MESLKLFVPAVFITGQFLTLFSYPGDDGVSKGETFDFIVVGGGTAGCAIAARLAESGRHTVLLIETGGMPHPDLDIPAISVQLRSDTRWAKTYQTVPQQGAGLAQSGVIDVLRGNVLGGSSVINGMVTNRGSPNDYDNWANMTGDSSWSYANMLKYLRRFENYNGDYPSDQRGFGGPITISRQRYAPGSREWLEAGLELGYPVAEPNSPQLISFALHDFSKRNGRRVTSLNSYIEPLLQDLPNTKYSAGAKGRRSNLLVLIHTQATRIIFQGQRAVGIRFNSNSTRATYAKARNEVILTAGVFESPAILMRSGVGPKTVLDSAGVKAVKHLPVGQNLHDHASVSLIIVFGNRSAALDPTTDLNPESWQKFLHFGDGPYSSYLGQSNQAFHASSLLPAWERRLGWPDIHSHALHANTDVVPGGFGVVSDLRDNEITVRWATYASRPKSRGSVTLNASDVYGDPLIDFQYLTSLYDMKVTVEGIKMLVRLCEETRAFQRIGCRVPSNTIPGCGHLKFRSDAYWRCYARQVTAHGFHAVGTCRMGRGEADPDAVVDTKLRVIGIEGLRAADASVMPTVTNVNTQAAVYAIAEKAAEMILNEWG